MLQNSPNVIVIDLKIESRDTQVWNTEHLSMLIAF